MKLSRGEVSVLVIAALLLALMGGYYLGTGQTRPLEPTVAAPRESEWPVVSAPAEEGEPSKTPKLVDINTAGLEELMTLPDIGEVRARAIIEDRTEHGPFEYVEDLIRVSGIGESTVQGLLEYATAGGTEYAENTGG